MSIGKNVEAVINGFKTLRYNLHAVKRIKVSRQTPKSDRVWEKHVPHSPTHVSQNSYFVFLPIPLYNLKSLPSAIFIEREREKERGGGDWIGKRREKERNVDGKAWGENERRKDREKQRETEGRKVLNDPCPNVPAKSSSSNKKNLSILPLYSAIFFRHWSHFTEWQQHVHSLYFLSIHALAVL